MADSSGNSSTVPEKEPVEQHADHRNHSHSHSHVDLAEIDHNDADLLAKMGYKQELKRNFSTLEVFGIAFSIISLLPSIASTLSYSVPAGPVGMVWGWFIPGGFIFLVGIAMGELASAMPTSGGLYWWTHFFASPKTRRPLCFLVGYSNTLGLVGCLCSVDYGFSLMFLSLIVIVRDGNWTPTNGAVYGTFLATILLHGVLATVLQRVINKLQTVSVVMNLILAFATIIALPIGARRHRHDGAFIFGHVDNLTTWPAGWAFMLAWLSPIWTIGDFDSCVHISEEAHNATKAVPRGIVASIGVSWWLGTILLIVISATIDPNLENVLSSPFGQPMAQIYYDALGKHGAMGFMALLFICQFQMGLSTLVAVSRQSWAFSRDGALPFSFFFRKISARFGYVPARCVWGCAIFGACLGLLCLIDNAAATALFSLCVAGNNLAWGIPIFSRLVWGQKKFKPGPFYTGHLWSQIIAWTAIAFLCFGIMLAMFPVGGPNPTPSTMNYTVVINSSVWGGALLYYFLDARKWFKGPKITLNLEELTAEQEQVLVDEGLEITGIDPASYDVTAGEKSGVPEERKAEEKEKQDELIKGV